ncbi:hypothetical protein EYF80_028759 [Liparis tanakae]|uniref:Uncharacterized protein n=1 Tax=Liparis tanakae TaxID=230148 RepID=A0A4Z2H5Q9_9TELE|nr:hypothetical protein EYF80_028759 [Liparis tanakae]
MKNQSGKTTTTTTTDARARVELFHHLSKWLVAASIPVPACHRLPSLHCHSSGYRPRPRPPSRSPPGAAHLQAPRSAHLLRPSSPPSCRRRRRFSSEQLPLGPGSL